NPEIGLESGRPRSLSVRQSVVSLARPAGFFACTFGLVPRGVWTATIPARACLGSPLRGRLAPKSAHGLPSGRSLCWYPVDARREERFEKRQGGCDGQHQ